MQKSRVEITESQLREIIKESVKQALINEGLWGGLKALGQKAGTAISNAYGNAKAAYQAGSAYQERTKAINQAMQSVEQLKQLFTQYKGSGVFNDKMVWTALGTLSKALNTNTSAEMYNQAMGGNYA